MCLVFLLKQEGRLKAHESRGTLEHRSVLCGGINLEARSDCGWRIEWSHVLSRPLISPRSAVSPSDVSYSTLAGDDAHSTG
jgi:hypothetical protein